MIRNIFLNCFHNKQTAICSHSPQLQINRLLKRWGPGQRLQSTNTRAGVTQQSGWFVLERQRSCKASKHGALYHFKMDITKADGKPSRRKRIQAFQQPRQRLSQFSVETNPSGFCAFFFYCFCFFFLMLILLHFCIDSGWIYEGRCPQKLINSHCFPCPLLQPFHFH